MNNKIPLYKCRECGRKFYKTQRALDNCPTCGGVDIDIYTGDET